MGQVLARLRRPLSICLGGIPCRVRNQGGSLTIVAFLTSWVKPQGTWASWYSVATC
jgi:hypothetical protein